ncbi:cytochrome c oxidase subunit 3 [Mycolicibacterium fortuitum]|uniref:cytochrome c oxidase subunit 3 n=1 Tax=Mycolicibacterium fortuitum TaxID=1766 RepID=UPI001F161D7E|nr:cytochrome c oxidase subunit 3 [Mycolicibacterium fortuitum]
MWIFILGDMCVFAMLFAVYLLYRGQDPSLFAEGQATLNRNSGALNTVLLLVSSLFVVIGLQALKRNLLDLSKRMVLLAALCGVGFVVVKAFEYSEQIGAGHTPGANSFYMYYFILTGLHLGHLLVGLAVLTVLYRMLASDREWTSQRFSMFEGGTCFWHMVDLLWIVLFPLIFLVR